jgi:hypothetical protein
MSRSGAAYAGADDMMRPADADLAMDFASMESIVPRMREAFFAQDPHRPS